MKAEDKTLRELTGYRLQRANGIAMLRYKEVFAQFGLRRTTFSCLSLIIDNPGLKQSQLGETLAIDRPNLVYIVDDLTRAELIRRDVSQQDRRAYALHPTEKGLVIFGHALEAVRRLDGTIADGLSAKDHKALIAALDLIERNCATQLAKP